MLCLAWRFGSKDAWAGEADASVAKARANSFVEDMIADFLGV